MILICHAFVSAPKTVMIHLSRQYYVETHGFCLHSTLEDTRASRQAEFETVGNESEKPSATTTVPISVSEPQRAHTMVAITLITYLLQAPPHTPIFSAS